MVKTLNLKYLMQSYNEIKLIYKKIITVTIISDIGTIISDTTTINSIVHTSTAAAAINNDNSSADADSTRVITIGHPSADSYI